MSNNINNQQDALAVLFDILAEDLADKIKSGEASPKELDIARQMLRDNGYQANAGKNPHLQGMAQVLPFPAEDGMEDLKSEVSVKDIG